MSSPTPPPVDPTGAAWNTYVNSQSFNVTGLDGTPTTLSFPDVDSLAYMRTTTGIVAGFAIGFCAQLFIVLLLLTPPDRRRQPIFLLNMTSLCLLVFNNICVAVVESASYQNAGPQLLGAFFAYGKSTWVPIVIQSILNAFLYLSIMSSLVLQTRVVFAARPAGPSRSWVPWQCWWNSALPPQIALTRSFCSILIRALWLCRTGFIAR